LLATSNAAAQANKTDVSTFQLGNRSISIPAPKGFEEATSQFETIRKRIQLTGIPGNDILAAYLPREVCDKLRAGEPGSFAFYSKISIANESREVDSSAAQFADQIADFRKGSPQWLDTKGPLMKAVSEMMSKRVSGEIKQDTDISLSDSTNLGEFGTKPDGYSTMLLTKVRVDVANKQRIRFVVASASLVRVKQRIVNVFAYRNFESNNDAELLRDFTQQWISQILAAN
jgi:hypothetical protein